MLNRARIFYTLKDAALSLRSSPPLPLFVGTQTRATGGSEAG